ncbi:hypothetical protein FIBSPDRAFT_855276, partial [Athelia psychrophila]
MYSWITSGAWKDAGSEITFRLLLNGYIFDCVAHEALQDSGSSTLGILGFTLKDAV